MGKIIMNEPLVEMNGDEMTRIIWDEIKKNLILPYINYKSVYFDLSLENREKTKDSVTMEAAKATKKYKVAVKCATITPNMQRKEEYALSELWKSPNATIRAFLDGTVFREPILVKNIETLVKGWEKPIIIARHAYGDIYKATELVIKNNDCVYLSIERNDTTIKEKIFKFNDTDGIVLGMYNTDKSIYSFAKSCFEYALNQKQDLWFATKDTISKIYDHKFKDIFNKLYEDEYKDKFVKNNINYFYTLIDDAIARVIKSKGGFVWACKNYDGDVMSDFIATAFGSLAMMKSVLISPDGCYEYEAAHGTVQRHYYKYLKGEKTSTNSIATIFAWSGALKKRGELDNNNDLIKFAENLENTTLNVVESGVMTKDLAEICNDNNVKIVDYKNFILEIAKNL